jgi:Zn-dependent protease
MLKFRVFGVPVVIEWWFWLSAVLLGGGMNARGPDAWAAVAVWTGVMFVSILVHEMGHALAGIHFGARPGIKLHGFGGLTYLPGANFSRSQSIAISTAGPMAGLLLGCLVLALIKVTPPSSGLVWFACRQALYINFFWTFINLLPIQPLDGGQILREVLGPSRIRVTALIGAVLAVLLCVWSLREGRIYLGLMLAFFAYYNFRQEPVEGGVIKG